MLDKMKAIANTPAGRRFVLVVDLLTLACVLAMLFGLQMPLYMRVLGGGAALALALGLLPTLSDLIDRRRPPNA